MVCEMAPVLKMTGTWCMGLTCPGRSSSTSQQEEAAIFENEQKVPGRGGAHPRTRTSDAKTLWPAGAWCQGRLASVAGGAMLR